MIKMHLYIEGADVSLKKKIQVRFVSFNSDFERRPMSHTCGCVLELAQSFECYSLFKNEFDCALTSGYWSMDVI
jgi:hypothetical protein